MKAGKWKISVKKGRKALRAPYKSWEITRLYSRERQMVASNIGFKEQLEEYWSKQPGV